MNLTIRLVPVTRTDLMCIACGGFRTEYSIETVAAEEPQVGVHERCIDKVQFHNTRSSYEEA